MFIHKTKQQLKEIYLKHKNTNLVGVKDSTTNHFINMTPIVDKEI